MMREWPYTASSQDALGCTSPPTLRFPSALYMSLRLCPRYISQASRNLLVVGDVQPNTSLLSAVAKEKLDEKVLIHLEFISYFMLF